MTCYPISGMESVLMLCVTDVPAVEACSCVRTDRGWFATCASSISQHSMSPQLLLLPHLHQSRSLPSSHAHSLCPGVQLMNCTAILSCLPFLHADNLDHKCHPYCQLHGHYIWQCQDCTDAHKHGFSVLVSSGNLCTAGMHVL